MGFVGNYAPCGLSPQTDGMPVIQQKEHPEMLLFDYSLFVRLIYKLLRVLLPVHRAVPCCHH